MNPSTVCARCLFRTIRNVHTKSRGKIPGSPSPQYIPVRESHIGAIRSLHLRNQRATSTIFLSRQFYSTIPQPSSSPAPPPPPLASQEPTSILLNPRYSSSGEELSINISPRAAHRLSQLIKTDNNPQLCLRVQVESGGCHGFQYLMSLTSTKKLDRDEDTLFVITPTAEAIPSVIEDLGSLGNGLPKVAMDRSTLELLEGSKVDYTMELIGSQFKIVDNPRATSSCGCGTSFDLKGDSSNGWGI
jgi:Fe-S cluster assembly iron-binding protein IscA